MSEDDSKAPRATVDVGAEGAESHAARERPDGRDDAGDGAPDTACDPDDGGLGGKASAWLGRTLPGHEHAFAGGVLGLVAAILIFCVGALSTILIVVLVVVGVALGQVLDGDPAIANAVIKFFSDRRE